MALDAATLADQLRIALLADPKSQAIDNDALAAVCTAIATAVVSHIVAMGIVLPLLMVAPPGGGPVTGTGVIT